MPLHDILIEVTVTALRADQPRTSSVAFRLPANGAIGVAIADPGKLKLGTAAEQLGTLVDEHKSDL